MTQEHGNVMESCLGHLCQVQVSNLGKTLSDWAGRNLGRKVWFRWKFLDPKTVGSSRSIEDGVLRTEDRGWMVNLFIYDLFVTHSNHVTM